MSNEANNPSNLNNPENLQDVKSCLEEIRNLQNELEKEKKSADKKEKLMSASLEESKQMSAYLKQLTNALTKERKATLQKTEKEKLLWKLIEKINSSFDLEQILQSTVDELGYYFKVSRCGIIIPNYKQNNKDLVREYATGEWKRSKETYSQVSMSALYRTVLKTLQPLVINDSLTHDLTAGHLTEDLRSILMVPLLQGANELVGVIYLHQCRQQRTWTKYEYSMLEAAANPIATAVAKSRIFSKAKQWASREKLLNRLTSRIRGTLNIKVILERTVAELGQALQVSRCFINIIDPKTSREVVAHEFIGTNITSLGTGKENPLIINKIAEKESDYIAISDLFKDSRMAKLNKAELEQLHKINARAFLAVPINFHTKLFGWLCFHQCNVPRNWTDEEIAFIQSAASQVAVAINQAEMVQELSEYKNKLSRELKQAAQLQSILLSGGADTNKNLKIAVSYHPHHNVSGDFYWVHELAPHVIGILIGDVSGKGPAAALLTGYIIGELKGLIEREEIAWHPDKFITGLSDSIYEQNQYSDFYATAWYGIFNITAGKIVCCNAGHPSPYLMQKDKISKLQDNPGVPLGLLSVKDVGAYETKEFALNIGDKMIVFTDGLTEQRQLKGEFISESWLPDALKYHQKYKLEELPEEIIRRLNIVSEGAPQDDDRLLVAIEMPEMNTIEFRDINQEDIQNKIKVILDEVFKKGLSENYVTSLKLGLVEAIYNSLRHGMPTTKQDKEKYIKLSYWIKEGSFSCVIADSGTGFDWKEYLTKKQSIKDVDVLEEGGRGLPLILEIFNDVKWNIKGNEIGLKLNW